MLPSAGALAADIPNIPPPPPMHFGKTWYLRGDIGMTPSMWAASTMPLYDDAGIDTVTNLSKDF